MAKRAPELGDTGDEAPDTWQLRDLEILVTVFAREKQWLAGPRAGPHPSGSLHERQVAVRYDEEGHKPFGFRDGISQPAIRDPAAGPHRRGHTHTEIWPGEFVLGYRDQCGPVPVPPPLLRNGSYTVVRQLEQDVEGFRRHLEDEARGEEGLRDLVAAKLIGRKPRNAARRVAGRPARNRGAVSSHQVSRRSQRQAGAARRAIRRANPRDSLGKPAVIDPPPDHRRACPYLDGGGKPTGLMFVCHQADILRQFKFNPAALAQRRKRLRARPRHRFRRHQAVREADDPRPRQGAHAAPQAFHHPARRRLLLHAPGSPRCARSLGSRCTLCSPVHASGA